MRGAHHLPSRESPPDPPVVKTPRSALTPGPASPTRRLEDPSRHGPHGAATGRYRARHSLDPGIGALLGPGAGGGDGLPSCWRPVAQRASVSGRGRADLTKSPGGCSPAAPIRAPRSSASDGGRATVGSDGHGCEPSALCPVDGARVRHQQINFSCSGAPAAVTVGSSGVRGAAAAHEQLSSGPDHSHRFYAQFGGDATLVATDQDGRVVCHVNLAFPEDAVDQISVGVPAGEPRGPAPFFPEEVTEHPQPDPVVVPVVRDPVIGRRGDEQAGLDAVE